MGFFRLLLFLFPLAVTSQSLELEINIADPEHFHGKLRYERMAADSLQAIKIADQVMRSLYEYGHLAAVIESTQIKEKKMVVSMRVNIPFEWATLRMNAEVESFLEMAGLDRHRKPDGVFHYEKLNSFMEAILKFGEEHGYPFIRAGLDSVTITENKLYAALFIQKGPLIVIDSVIVKGDAKVSPIFIQSHLGIKPGDIYNERAMRSVSTRLKEIPFLKESKPAEIVFIKEKVQVRLYLEKKRASQFDGIIGFLPDARTGKTTITGDIRLKVQNAFSRGESHEFNWRQLQTQTQDLKTHFYYPYLFQTPFCLDIRFKLYKKDTSWIDVNPVVGLEYKLTGKKSLRGFVDRRTLNLLTTNAFQQSSGLPAAGDVQSTQYGLSLKLEDLDYRYNPRKGYQCIFTGKAGNKKIIPNAGIGDAAYQNVDLTTSQYGLEGECRLFIPVFKRGVIMHAIRGAGLFSENIFQNELFRIGGTQTVRGFDEESISCTSYGAATVEYRFLLEQNSYLHLFGEGAYYENYSLTNARNGTLLSFGTGISFETKAGIFSLSYALGSELPAGPDLRNGKVHFGITGLF